MKSNSLLHEANEALRDLKRRSTNLALQLESLEEYAGWTLITEGKKRSNRVYYDAFRGDSPKKIYLGGEQNGHVLNVKRYRYAKRAKAIIDSDISLIETLVNGFIQPDYDTINSMLPATYRTSVNGDGGTMGMPAEAVRWLEQKKAEKAKHPPYRPEQLKHPAMDGTMMRSKSEVIIANMLIAAGIPFVYEMPMIINDETVLPDFTILSLIDLKTVILIEHQGMMFVDSYANKFIRSLKLYLHSSWVPNKNLFFTFDNAQETVDPAQVISILRKHVKPSI